MFIHTEQEKKTHIETDICIVGAGAAGITLALALESSGASVCLLESGVLDDGDSSEGADALYEFDTDMLPIPSASRRRAFGGTMTIWSGRWKLPDEIDFATRAWVPHSGWPIALSSLTPFFERVRALLHVPDVFRKVEIPTLLQTSDLYAQNVEIM